MSQKFEENQWYNNFTFDVVFPPNHSTIISISSILFFSSHYHLNYKVQPSNAHSSRRIVLKRQNHFSLVSSRLKSDTWAHTPTPSLLGPKRMREKNGQVPIEKPQPLLFFLVASQNSLRFLWEAWNGFNEETATFSPLFFSCSL